MKKRTIRLAALSLMMTVMLFNCKDKDETTDPKAPPTEITDALNAVVLTPPTAVKPVEVTSTASGVEASAKAAEVNDALGDIASTGTVPASVSTAAAETKSALSDAEISTLSSISSETVNAVAAGGELSPELQAVIDKAMANPALAAYFPKFTFPTVNGVALKGAKGKRVGGDISASNARTTGTDAVEKVEGVLVDDACITAANTLFNNAKARLDASKATQDAAFTAQYTTDIAPIAGDLASCLASVTPKYVEYRASAQQTLASALASIDAAQAALGDQYAAIRALVNAAGLGALSTYNTLEEADKQACTAIATAKTASFAAARDANLANVNANYTTALAEATRLQGEAIRSCHNQGGGN